MGVVTDTRCGGRHEVTNPETAGACVKECVRNSEDVKYALYNGTTLYVLSGQQTPEKFAAQEIQVTGSLEKGTMVLRIKSIKAST